jgi:integrase
VTTPDNVDGGYQYASNFRKFVWVKIREAAGIPDTFVFHDLRHTQASLLLAAGVDLKVIQKRLGQADFATTANLYAHLMQGAQADATEKLDDMLRKSKPKPAKKKGSQ